MTEFSAHFTDFTGKPCDVTLNMTDYMEAADKKVSLSQLYATKFPTKMGGPSAFEQFCASADIRLRADAAHGIPASNMKEIFMGTIVRGTGADRQTTTGRLLFPEIMMNMVNENLLVSKEDYLTPWEAAIALRTSISGPRADQPRINVTAPEASAAQPIGQLSEPAVMVTITLSDKSYTIPTKSIGLQIADEALQATTIDLVGLTLAAQARGERIRRIEEDMANIIAGDTDFGITAVPFQNASVFDATIPGTNPTLTHRAYVKWLREHYQKLSITHILCDIDAALDVDGRTGRPQALNDSSAQQNRVNVDYSIENLGLPAPKMLLLPTSIIGANRLVGFDSKFGLHEITNVSASYSAIEEFVLRRGKGMRFDYGVALVKFQDEAFTGLTLKA